MASKAKGRKGRLGKHRAGIAAYYASYRWELNKARRIHRHMRRFKCWHKDVVAHDRLSELLAVMPVGKARLFGSVQ
jgi:hypothetical protein